MAPLQLKGCTRTPSLSSTTTPSGASERRHCQCLSLHFDHGVEQACSAAARVPPRSPLPGTPPSFSPVLCLRYVRGVFSSRVDSLPPSGSGTGIRSSLRLSLRVHRCAGVLHAGRYVNRGVRTCFPGAIDTEFGHRNSFVFLTESLIHGDPVNRGVRTSFPGRDRVPVRPLWFQGPHSYVALARPDQRPRACVVRGRLVQRHRLRSGSVGLATGFGLK